MRLILHFFAAKEGTMRCACSGGQRVCEARLEEVNTGVGGVKPRSPAHACFHLMLLFNRLFIFFSPLFALEIQDEV